MRAAAHHNHSHDHDADRPALMRNREFLALWTSHILTALGDRLVQVALVAMFLHIDRAGTTELYRDITFTALLPMFLFSVTSGGVVDRMPRRLVLILSTIVRVLVASLLVVMAVQAEGGAPSRWMVLGGVFLVGLGTTLFVPARDALIPDLVRERDLVTANGLARSTGSVVTLLGTLLGGWLAELAGATAALALTVGAFLLGGAVLGLIRSTAGTRPPPAEAAPSVEGGERSGVGDVAADLADEAPPPRRRRAPSRRPPGTWRSSFGYLRTHARVGELVMITSAFWGAAAIIFIATASLPVDRFGGDASSIGVFQALLGGGLLLGALLASPLGKIVRGEIVLSWATMTLGVAVAALSFSWAPYAALTLLVLGGVSGGLVLVHAETLIQRIVPARLRGRIFGTKNMFNNGAYLLTTLVLLPVEDLDAWMAPLLALLGLAIVGFGFVTMLVRLKRSPMAPPIAFLRNFLEIYLRALHRFRVVGRVRLPESGGAILVANHTSSLDAIYMALSVRRTVSFMMAREFYDKPVIHLVVESLSCIPVNRTGSDAAAVKAALRVLREGNCLGIFPEGKINLDGVGEGKPGVALLALRLGVPVVPIYFDGTVVTHNMLKPARTPARVTAHIGEPVDLSPWRAVEKPGREDLVAATRAIMQAIRALRPGEAPAQEPVAVAAPSP